MNLKIKLHPNSSQEKIEKISENSRDAVSIRGNKKMPPFHILRKEREENRRLPRYEVWLKEKPIDNKANVALEKFLKKYFNKSVKIVKGFKSKNKVVEVGE